MKIEHPNIEHIHTTMEKPAKYANFPLNMHPSIQKALISRGIEQLYIHQRLAFDHAMLGKSYTTITPTASGKSSMLSSACSPVDFRRPNFKSNLFISYKSISTRSKK